MEWISHQNRDHTTHGLHPPTPFLLPHKALETCEVMNYTIPKNSKVSRNK